MPSLLEGIESKYGYNGSMMELPMIYLRKSQGRLPPVLVFNDFGIDSAGHEESLKTKCQHVQELDLAQNSLSQWNEVLTILYHMPSLQFANLSFNCLTECLRDDLLKGCFPRLKNLILNGTHIDWVSVSKLVSNLPCLEELHLSLNGYEEVCLEDSERKGPLVHGGVKRLFFTDNTIKSWQEACKLGASFPELDTLVLADCPIESLEDTIESRLHPSPQDDNGASRQQSVASGESYCRSESECEGCQEYATQRSPHHHFRNLKFLNLNNTLISSWVDIDKLACFPNLRHLRIHAIPLLEGLEETAHERRQLLIARLPNIVKLNGGGEISKDDREDSERAFIRHFMDKPESDRPDRYNDLVGVHGKLDPLVNIDLSPDRYVKVLLTCGSRSEARSLNVYQTVSELKQKLENFAGLPCSKMKLYYVDQEMRSAFGPEEMKFPNKQLYSYNIACGDEIIIDSKK